MELLQGLFKNPKFAVISLLALSLGLAVPLEAQPWKLPPDRSEAPAELIVLLAPASQAPSPAQVVAAVGSAEGDEEGASRKGLDRAFLRGSPLSARPALTRPLGAATARGADEPRARLERYVVLKYPQGTDLEPILAALAASPQVQHVEKNVLFRMATSPTNDPLVDDQWGHFTLAIPDAWNREKGHAYIGLIDYGLYVNHPDLRPFSTHVQAGTLCSYSGTTFEGGAFRPQFSWNFAANGCNVDERVSPATSGHGTHVAGIVAATPNNSIGVAGVCQGCSLMITKPNFFTNNNSVLLSSTADALTYLVDHGVQAVSMSWGIGGLACSGSGGLGLFCQALAYAEERDVALTASPGNDQTDIEFPASDARVLSIGGLASDGTSFWDRGDEGGGCPCNWAGLPSGFLDDCLATPTFECGSNFTSGDADDPDTQDLVAPAQDVISTFYPGYDHSAFLECGHTSLPSGYGPCTGTSMSSPYVAGLIGILRSANPLLDKSEIRDALVTNASRANSWDVELGYGVPDADASVIAALGTSGGQPLRNRLTPLFVLYSSSVTAHFYTTVPQMASAMVLNATTPYSQYASTPVLPPAVGGYTAYPGASCLSSPCDTKLPRASVYLFTSDAAPWQDAPGLIPLYRMSYKGSWSSAFYYTTDVAELEAASADYQFDGIEGYLFPRPEKGSACTVAGTTRLLRLYKSAINDYALFPESELEDYETAGYELEHGAQDWIGCVYPNTDADDDHVIDGFEDVAGTNPLDDDTDCDALSDGDELLVYDSNGYGDPLEGSCLSVNRLLFDSFTGSGAVNGRTTEVGGATWAAQPAATVSGGKVIDLRAIGGVPFEPPVLGSHSAVTVDIDPSDSEWVGAGFSSDATTAYWTAGQLWALVRSTGTYAVFADGSQVASGSIPGTPVNGFHTVKVQYNPSTLNATAWINGTQVYTQTLGSALDIHAAGFHFHRSAAGGGKIDNFDVSVQGTSVISDTFAGSGMVHGRSAETGSVTWSSGIAVVSGGRVLDNDAIAGVAFDPLLLPGNPTVVVKGDINPVVSAWGGLGFANQGTAAYWSAGKLWALVKSTGTYEVFAGGSQVASGTIPGTPVSGFHHIEAQYSPSSLAASVSINGTVVYAQTLGSALDIDYAGFHTYRGAEGAGGVDNFEVAATSAP